MKATSGYPIVSWDEVKKRNPDAYSRFHLMATVWTNNPRLRPVFQALLPVKRKVPQVESVMDLFIVRAKRNWRWIGVELRNEAMGVLTAAGMQEIIPISSTVNVHTRWWH